MTVVRFRNRRIAKEIDVQEFGSEMSSLVENDKPAKLLLNFSTVEYLGSPVLGRLVTLERKLKTLGGAWLSNIRPSIYEILAIVKLDRLFDVKDDEADALAAFSAI